MRSALENVYEAIVAALEKYDYFSFAKAMEYHFSSGKYSPGDAYWEEPEKGVQQ